MDKIIGGRLAADALIERDVEYIFSLSGGHITPIYQFLENSRITIFDTRHEQAAVFMAEAWARMTRKPAVAMVTAGPGFTNALSGIASARLSNAPVILIAGCVGLESVEKLDLQDMTQLPVIEPMVKKAFVCHIAGADSRIHRHGLPGGHERPARPGLPGAALRRSECRHRSGQGEEDAHGAASIPSRRTGKNTRRSSSCSRRRKIPSSSPAAAPGMPMREKDFAEFVERTGSPGLHGGAGRGRISRHPPPLLRSRPWPSGPVRP